MATKGGPRERKLGAKRNEGRDGGRGAEARGREGDKEKAKNRLKTSTSIAELAGIRPRSK